MPFETKSTPQLTAYASELDALLERMPGIGEPGFWEAAVLLVVEEQLKVAAERKRRDLTAGEPFDPYCEF